MIEAEEAYWFKIYNRLVPGERFMAEAMGSGEMIPKYPPLAVKQVKKAS